MSYSTSRTRVARVRSGRCGRCGFLPRAVASLHAQLLLFHLHPRAALLSRNGCRAHASESVSQCCVPRTQAPCKLWPCYLPWQ